MDSMSHDFIDHMDENAGLIFSNVPPDHTEVLVHLGDEFHKFTRLELAQWAVRAAEDQEFAAMFGVEPEEEEPEPTRAEQLAVAVHEQAMAIVRLNKSLIEAGALADADEVFYDQATHVAATLVDSWGTDDE